MPANLMGVDVGFSKTRRTTGIACLEGGRLTLKRAGTSWESRKSKIPDGFRASIIAIDGPLIPRGPDQHIRRGVEFLFSRSPFHNRCKPGLSHSGVGFQFRLASEDAYNQFSPILAPFVLRNDDGVHCEGPIVEAFPNAFLGVMMPEVKMLTASQFKRGRRFDWLYDEMVATRKLESLLSKDLNLPNEVWQRLCSETDHELRAALICLLTAALADKGTAKIVGDAEGGWFWLPPFALWEPWASEGLESGMNQMAVKANSGPTMPSFVPINL